MLTKSRAVWRRRIRAVLKHFRWTI